MNTKQRQLKFVLDHLESGETLTAVKARCIYGIESLSSRISELKKQGHKIESIEIGGGFVKYVLDDNQPFEREFFDFLQRNDALDSYIHNRITALEKTGKPEFELPDRPVAYISRALCWSETGQGFNFWERLNVKWRNKFQSLTTRRHV